MLLLFIVQLCFKLDIDEVDKTLPWKLFDELFFYFFAKTRICSGFRVKSPLLIKLFLSKSYGSYVIYRCF